MKYLFQSKTFRIIIEKKSNNLHFEDHPYFIFILFESFFEFGENIYSMTKMKNRNERN